VVAWCTLLLPSLASFVAQSKIQCGIKWATGNSTTPRMRLSICWHDFDKRSRQKQRISSYWDISWSSSLAQQYSATRSFESLRPPICEPHRLEFLEAHPPWISRHLKSSGQKLRTEMVCASAGMFSQALEWCVNSTSPVAFLWQFLIYDILGSFPPCCAHWSPLHAAERKAWDPSITVWACHLQAAM